MSLIAAAHPPAMLLILLPHDWQSSLSASLLTAPVTWRRQSFCHASRFTSHHPMLLLLLLWLRYCYMSCHLHLWLSYTYSFSVSHSNCYVCIYICIYVLLSWTVKDLSKSPVEAFVKVMSKIYITFSVLSASIPLAAVSVLYTSKCKKSKVSELPMCCIFTFHWYTVTDIKYTWKN